MKTLRVLAVSAAVLAVASPAFADEKVVTDEGIATFSFFKPASVRLEATNVGYGGAVSWSVNPYTALTLGYDGGDASDIIGGDVRYKGVKYDLDQDNNTPYLNVEIRPWGNWFYAALGTAYNDNEYKIKQANHTGTLSINGNDYDASTTHLQGKVEYKNNIVPYVGLGISPAITNRFGVFAEIGTFYNGNPKVSLHDNTNANLQYQADIAREADKIRNDDKYKWMPVGKIGLSMRF